MRKDTFRPKYQRQIEAQLADGAATVAVTHTPSKFDIKAESDLQVLCENWLHHRGYHRLSADNAERQFKEKALCLGWFGHLHKPKQNPLMPDIFIFGERNRYLQVELKIRKEYQPGQKEMIEMGWWKLALTFDEFKWEIEKWEAGL